MDRLISQEDAEACLKVWEICSGATTAGQALRTLTGLRSHLRREPTENLHPEDLALLEDYMKAQKEEAFKKRVATKARLRETAQILIAEVGADGPMNAEKAARKAVAQISEQRSTSLFCRRLLKEMHALGVHEITVDALEDMILEMPPPEVQAWEPAGNAEHDTEESYTAARAIYAALNPDAP